MTVNLVHSCIVLCFLRASVSALLTTTLNNKPRHWLRLSDHERAMTGHPFRSTTLTATTTATTTIANTDFMALGLGGTNMMCMLWSLVMGKKCVGVEIRGDPFLLIHWNIRADLYHQLGLIDDLMMKRYGKKGVPRRANGKIFKLSECFYSPKTTSGYVVADEVIDGHDKIHHIAGTIEHIEFMDDRYKDGKPHRAVTVLPSPKIPKKPDPKAIRTSVREVLDGPSTFQSEANNILILLRRYLEAVEAMDKELGVEPRVQLFKRHRVKEQDGFVKDDEGRVTINIEELQEMDYKGKLIRVPISNDFITIESPELCVIAQGADSVDAKRLGFQQHDVEVDHHDGRGLTVAQADYLAGFIDVLVDGRIRRRIASSFDEKGQEYWVRQIAVGHEGDPQVGWVLVQVPDYMTFCPVEAGCVPKGTNKESAEYYAAHQRLMYEFYIEETAKILEIPANVLKEARMAYGPKIFSNVERCGRSPHICPNVFVAGDSFGNGHFLTSGGAMTGMVGHSMAVLNYWKAREGNDGCEERAKAALAQEIKKGTQDWLDSSAKEFSSFTPINFGMDRINQIAQDTQVDFSARAQSIEAARRKRHEMKVQDPSHWRRPFFRNGKVITDRLKIPISA